MIANGIFAVGTCLVPGGEEIKVAEAGEVAGGVRLFKNQFPKDTPNIANSLRLSPAQFKAFDGRLNYVVTKEGNLIVGKRGAVSEVGHIDLAEGQPVQAAGEFKIVNGQIKYIDNSSGHYQPSGIVAQRAAADAFGKLGYDIGTKYVEKAWVNDPALPRGGAWRICK